MRRALPSLALLLTLAACGDPGAGDYPRLVPVETVLAEPALPAHASADPAAVQGELGAARDRLRADAAAPAPSGSADLAARAAALRARAAQIQAEACRDALPGSAAATGCPR